ncbi:MAG: hypothetical protein ACREYE_15990, partial [Gammaproteobacteria bacterium]
IIKKIERARVKMEQIKPRSTLPRGKKEGGLTVKLFKGHYTSTESRVQAVEALWRHTADHAFDDENAVASLEQLAEDADPRVSTIALQALQDMKQFQQNNAAQ